MGLLQKQFRDEDAARVWLEKALWPDGPVCPKCGVINEATKLRPKEGSANPARKGLYQCNGCRAQFTVTVNTIFEDSHIPLHKWLLALQLESSKNRLNLPANRRLVGWGKRGIGNGGAAGIF